MQYAYLQHLQYVYNTFYISLMITTSQCDGCGCMSAISFEMSGCMFVVDKRRTS